MRSVLSVCLSVNLCVCHSVNKMTHELVYRRRPKLVDMGNG